MRGLSPGTRLGRYSVVRRIGSGGMAELYLGRLDGPERFVKPVALKLMHPHLSDDAHFARMFLKEARIAATLEHAAIVQVLDVGEFGGEYFMALEFVHGKDLRRLLADQRGAPMPLGCALRIVMETGRALHYAHRVRDPSGRALAIVHRDVSPSNVLLSFQGAVKLADFGVAKMAERTTATASGSLKGKMGYMSPEQCLQEYIDARSDVFSLGVVLYEATTGRRAFRADQPVAVMNRVIEGDWTSPETFNPDYPPRLLEILQRALAVDLEDRYPSAEAMVEDLEDHAAEAGHDTHAQSLAAFLQQQYGQPALPDLATPTLQTPVLRTMVLEEETLVRHAPRRAGLPRGARAAAVLVGVLGLGGAVGWQMGRVSGDDAPSIVDEPVGSPMAAPAQQAAVAVTPEPHPTAVVEADVPSPVAEPTEDALPVIDDEPSDADAEAEPAAKPASSRRRRRSRRSRTDRKSETDKARDILFPQSDR